MTVALITGGSGFFGSALARRLAASGAAVRVFDVLDAPDRPPEVEFVSGDIRDPAAVGRACDGADLVYHCVALVPLAKDVKAFWSVNLDGTRVLLEACRDRRTAKVVNLSSSAVYGAPEQNPVDEDTPPDPQEDYGRAKLAAERLCREFAAAGLDITVIRPRTIMGPGRLGIMQIM